MWKTWARKSRRVRATPLIDRRSAGILVQGAERHVIRVPPLQRCPAFPDHPFQAVGPVYSRRPDVVFKSGTRLA